MFKHKKLAMLLTVILVIGVTTITAFAAGYKTPAEVVAGLTGKTVEAVTAERADTGKTYGTIANEAGKLDAFKAEMLETKKAYLADQVAAGKITQARADEIIAAIEANQENCDGTGSGRIGRGMGAGFGRGMGGRMMGGTGNRAGCGMGAGAVSGQ